jgi:hypothetical protein
MCNMIVMYCHDVIALLCCVRWCYITIAVDEAPLNKIKCVVKVRNFIF